MDREQLLSQWREEAARGMSGWDFSHIQGRCTVETLPWDYPQVVREFLRPGVRLLDMGTGGGCSPWATPTSSPPSPRAGSPTWPCARRSLRPWASP